MKHHTSNGLAIAVLVVLIGMLLVRSVLAQQGASTPIFPAGPDLTRMSRLIQSHLLATDRTLLALENRMPPLVENLENLIERIEDVRPPRPDDDPPPEAEGPIQHRWRPPLEHATRKGQVAIVCSEGRLAVLPDARVIGKHCIKLALRRHSKTEEVERVEFELADCSIRFQLTMEGRRGQDGWKVAVTIVGNSGETVEEAMREGSQFRKVLASQDPDKKYMAFLVWPDSYSVFHQARTLAWDAGFDAGWMLFRSGEPLQFGVGAGAIQ